MGIPFNSVSEAQDRANALSDYAQELEARISDLQAEKIAVQLMKEATLEWITAKSISSPEDSSQPVSIEDIQHCRTQREILREWALRNGGYARLGNVASLVMEAGKARGKRVSVRATLNNYCRDSDEWQYDEPGVYRLVETIPVEALPEDSSQPDNPGSASSPADSSGDSSRSEATNDFSPPLAVA